MSKAYYYEAPKPEDYAEAMQRGNEYAKKAAEARRVAIEVLSAFTDKKCGAKTREKINAAAKALGWALIISNGGSTIRMYKLTDTGSYDNGGIIEFCVGFLNNDNKLNAEAINTAMAYSGEGCSTKIPVTKLLAKDELNKKAKELSAAAGDVFEAVRKAAEAVEAYNKIAEDAPNVSRLYGGDFSAGGYAKIKIV